MSLASRTKAVLRQIARARRASASETSGDRASRDLRDVFLANIDLPMGAVVGGYWPIGSEMDVRPLLESLLSLGHPCALPWSGPKGQALKFLSWMPGVQLVADEAGILAPDPSSAEEIVPDVVLVPLLAFAPEGHRLGYGAGYYDITLTDLRARKPVLAVGIAFAAQEMPDLPKDPHDEALDWIVTEEFARRTGRAEG